MPVFLSTTAKDLVRSTFFGKDFETCVNEIINFMRLEFGDEVTSNLTAPSSPGRTLIEMAAFGLSTGYWYGDRQADDTNLRDVRLRTAAVVIARMLGYKAGAAVPAAVTLTLTLDFAPTITRLTLEKGRELVGPGGLSYVMAEEVIFEVGEVGPKSFAAREGTIVEEVFTSDGGQFQSFPLETIPTGKSIAQSSVRVFVNSLEWFESPLLTYNQTNQFEVGYGFNPPLIQFGDGIAGNVPPANTEIRVNYLATLGPDGAVPAQSVLAFAQPLVAGSQTITGVLDQPDPSTPGSPPEPISSIKVNAPLVFQTADRAVTQTDYDALINAFIDPVYGAVAIGRATVPRSVDGDAEALSIIAQLNAEGVTPSVVTDLTTYWNKVLASNCKANVVVAQILAADTSGRYVVAPVGLAQALEAYLDERAESTVRVTVADGSINLLRVDLSADIKLLEGYTGEAVRESIRTAVRDVLEDALLGRSYGASLRISDLYALAEGIEGVDYANIAVTAVNGNPPAPYLNAYGDLPLQDYQVITLGDPVTVSLL